ncbi:hypothetical protein MTsDn1_15230 [Alteromonas sp. MTD1]|uniref:hypothetical protein n=1 Tax=Alteromonas sp. MTD1 TaxID=3057962 RepID=UPI0036F2AB35
MNLHEKEALLAAFLEGTLTQNQQDQFDALCQSDSDFAQRVDAASVIKNSADNFASPITPQWDKSSTFFEHTVTKSKASWFSLSSMAMATSACALLAVLTGAQLSFNQNSIALTFSATQAQKDVDTLVAEKVATALGEQREYYQQVNQTLFKEYAQALSTQQQRSSAELTQYLLASSREERKEDFAELLMFINDQRIDDQRFYAQQFSRLQDEIDDIEIGYSAVLNPQMTKPNMTTPNQGVRGNGKPYSLLNEPTPLIED